MAPGVLTLSPLLTSARRRTPAPNSSRRYEYVRIDCDNPDMYCPAGSDFWCWFANETTLIARWGLTNGVNAWVPVPPSLLPVFNVPVFAPGDSTSVVITASPGQKLSYIAKAGDFNTYVDQTVMMHATGNPADLTVPLFDGNGLPLSNITFDLGGYTVSSSSPTNGNSAQCGNYCPGAERADHWLLRRGRLGGDGCRASRSAGAVDHAAAVELVGAGWLHHRRHGARRPDLVQQQRHLVEMEGGNASGNTTGVGRAVVLSSSGAQQSKFDGLVAGNDFMGFPMIENFDGTGTSGYMVSRVRPGHAGAGRRVLRAQR